MNLDIADVRVDKPINIETFNYLLQFSPPEKQQRILRQRVKRNADTMVIGGALVRYILWKRFHIPLNALIAYGEFGKPFLVEYPDIYFNISHSGKYVACAVCDFPVGIDVQEITSFRPEVAARICSPVALTLIKESLDPDAEFTKIWTQTEALAKEMGFGIGEIFRCSTLHKKGVFSKRIDNTFVSLSCTMSILSDS
jgi:4'-phosphopantetheinyl transferase